MTTPEATRTARELLTSLSVHGHRFMVSEVDVFAVAAALEAAGAEGRHAWSEKDRVYADFISVSDERDALAARVRELEAEKGEMFTAQVLDECVAVETRALAGPLRAERDALAARVVALEAQAAALREALRDHSCNPVTTWCSQHNRYHGNSCAALAAAPALQMTADFTPRAIKFDAWIFTRSGGRANFGEVRFRLIGDTPMDDITIFEAGWARAPWLDGWMPATTFARAALAAAPAERAGEAE